MPSWLAKLTLSVCCLTFSSVASAYRAFTADEVRHIKYKNPVRQIYTGMTASTTISRDDAYLIFAELTDDIQSNVLVLLSTDGYRVRRIHKPYGHKMDPALLGGDYNDGRSSRHPRQLLALVRPYEKKRAKYGAMGIYSLAIDDAKATWKPWLMKKIKHFALSPDGDDLALVLGNLGEPGPAKHQELPYDHLAVQPITGGRPT